MNLETLKTTLSKQIEACQDYQSLYKSYYVMTSDKIEVHAKELFESRGLSITSPDFNYFMSDVVYDPSTTRTYEDTISLIKAFKDGKVLDNNYLDNSYQKVLNLRDCVDERISDTNLSKILNYVPTSLSTNSVGKGEYAFVLMTEGAEKPKRGGDLFINGQDIEVKANGAKMASQSTHIPQAAIKKDCIEFIEYKTGDRYDDILNLTAININNFYYELFGRDWRGVIDLLLFVFSKTMVHATQEDLSWINYDLIVDGHFDYFKFLEKLAIFEFTYYRHHDKFSRILFLNVDRFTFMNTDHMDEELLKKFKLTRSYSFKGERIQTNYWTLQ